MVNKKDVTFIMHKRLTIIKVLELKKEGFLVYERRLEEQSKMRKNSLYDMWRILKTSVARACKWERAPSDSYKFI